MITCDGCRIELSASDAINDIDSTGKKTGWVWCSKCFKEGKEEIKAVNQQIKDGSYYQVPELVY